MRSNAVTVKDYLKELNEDRLDQISKVRQVILSNLPGGYEEVMKLGHDCISGASGDLS